MKIYPGKMGRKRVLLGFLLGLGLFSVTARAELDKDVEELLAYSLRIASDLEKPFEKTAALVMQNLLFVYMLLQKVTPLKVVVGIHTK